MLEHERLNVLIKICRRNKTHNEEAIPELVLECNNFKKMIRIENDAIQQLKKKTEEVKKLTKKFVSNCPRESTSTSSLWTGSGAFLPKTPPSPTPTATSTT